MMIRKQVFAPNYFLITPTWFLAVSSYNPPSPPKFFYKSPFKYSAWCTKGNLLLQAFVQFLHHSIPLALPQVVNKPIVKTSWRMPGVYYTVTIPYDRPSPIRSHVVKLGTKTRIVTQGHGGHMRQKNQITSMTSEPCNGPWLLAIQILHHRHHLFPALGGLHY